ncbi:MAG: DUF2959 family protein [Thiotrichales bacterium]
MLTHTAHHPRLIRDGLVTLAVLLVIGGIAGCDRLDPTQLWKEPREILVDRVEVARDAQQTAVEEFQTTMEKFKAVTSFSGGDLETQFNTLDKAFRRSEAAANDITRRIDRVAGAARLLVDEWRAELDKYHDPSLRQRAERQLDETRLQSERLIDAMRMAEAKAKPVLDVFRDQVLFMKHNLNMQAITSLETQTAAIETDVADLIAEMRRSIDEAERFIGTLERGA